MSDTNDYQGAPPTEPMALLDEPKSWPKVIGIMSIVWGCLGLVCNACGVVMPKLVTYMLPDEMKNGPMPPNMTPGPLMYAMVALGMLVSVLLIVAGASLASRKRSGRPLHLAWGVLACIMGCVGLYLQWRINAETQVWMQQNPDTLWAKQQAKQGGGNIGLVIGLVMGVIFGFSYPVFCLVWFGLVKTNPAEIDAGVEDSVV